MHNNSRFSIPSILPALLLVTLASGLKAQGVDPKSFPIPRGARGVVVDQPNQQIVFQTDQPIKETAAFYKAKLTQKGWKAGFDQVASIFINVYYKKDGRTIKVKGKKKDIFKDTVTYTIIGDGFAWTAASKPKTSPALKKTSVSSKPPARTSSKKPQTKKEIADHSQAIDSSDFPLLENQSRSSDGGLEIIEFNSRKGPKENLAHYEARLAAKGWKKTIHKQIDGVSILHFGKAGLYIRVAFWPHTFSDNLGEHKGIKGAATGSGIRFHDDEPSGKPVERQLKSAERYLGKLSPARKRHLIFQLNKKRESAFWPEGKIPAAILAQLPGAPAGVAAAAPKKSPSSTVRPNKSTKSAPKTKTSKTVSNLSVPKAGTFKASITVNGRTYPLKHAVAFDGNWFDDKVPFVLFTERPISKDQLLAAVAKGFDAQELFMVRMRGRYLSIKCFKDRTQASGWADNLSFSGSARELISNVKVGDKDISGTLKAAKEMKLGPFRYHFQAEFNLKR